MRNDKNTKTAVMVSLVDASRILQKHAGNYVSKKMAENLRVSDSYHRVLFDDIYSENDFPSYDISTIDGFALNTTDLPGNSIAIVGEIKTGTDVVMLRRPNGVRIEVGAPVPIGANAVLPYEDSLILTQDKTSGTAFIIVKGNLSPGKGLKRRASLFCKNHLVLPGKTQLGVPEITILSMIGTRQVTVYPTISVALGYANEDIPIEFLRLACHKLGLKISYEDTIPDNHLGIRDFIHHAENVSDFILTVGGISTLRNSKFLSALNEWEEIKLIFQHVSIKPGKPFSFGQTQRKNRDLICLPGNIQALFVTFLWFVVPYIRARQGIISPEPVCHTVYSPEEYKADVHTRFIFAQHTVDLSGITVQVMPEQSATAIKNLVQADGVLILPANQHIPVGFPLQYFIFS